MIVVRLAGVALLFAVASARYGGSSYSYGGGGRGGGFRSSRMRTGGFHGHVGYRGTFGGLHMDFFKPTPLPWGWKHGEEVCPPVKKKETISIPLTAQICANRGPAGGNGYRHCICKTNKLARSADPVPEMPEYAKAYPASKKKTWWKKQHYSWVCDYMPVYGNIFQQIANTFKKAKYKISPCWSDGYVFQPGSVSCKYDKTCCCGLKKSRAMTCYYRGNQSKLIKWTEEDKRRKGKLAMGFRGSDIITGPREFTKPGDFGKAWKKNVGK